MPVEDPLLFVLSIVVSIFSIALIGFLLSVVVGALPDRLGAGQPAGVPGLAGVRLPGPAGVLPAWVTWIAYALPPTWGMQAIRAAAAGGSPWFDVLMCLGLGLVYGALGTVLSETVLRSARRNATLSLT